MSIIIAGHRGEVIAFHTDKLITTWKEGEYKMSQYKHIQQHMNASPALKGFRGETVVVYFVPQTQ